MANIVVWMLIVVNICNCDRNDVDLCIVIDAEEHRGDPPEQNRVISSQFPHADTSTLAHSSVMGIITTNNHWALLRSQAR